MPMLASENTSRTQVWMKILPDCITHYTASYALNGNKLQVKRELSIQSPTMVCGEDENEMDKQFFPVFQRDMRAQVRYE
jgi:heat shock protein HslJ